MEIKQATNRLVYMNFWLTGDVSRAKLNNLKKDVKLKQYMLFILRSSLIRKNNVLPNSAKGR